MAQAKRENWFKKMGELCERYPQLLDIEELKNIQVGHSFSNTSSLFARLHLSEEYPDKLYIFLRDGKCIQPELIPQPEAPYMEIGLALKQGLRQSAVKIELTDIAYLFVFVGGGQKSYTSILIDFSPSDFTDFLVSL